MLYRIAAGAPLPGLPGRRRSAVTPSPTAGPGYDLVTGLGTPDIDNLVRNLLILQEATQ